MSLRSLCLLIMLMALAIITACDLTEPQSNETLVREQLSAFERAFNTKDPAAMMDLVHHGYLHNNLNYWNFNQIWQDRMAQYALLEIREISIVFSGDYATASMRLDFIDPEGGQSYLEPQTNGDISYFYFTGSIWKICGKDYYPGRK